MLISVVVVSPSSSSYETLKSQTVTLVSVLDLRPLGLEFRIMCLESSVIPSSSGGSPGPAQRWHKTLFIRGPVTQ